MASKGLQAILYQTTRKVDADNKPSHTDETLIVYTTYNHFVFFICFFFFALSLKLVHFLYLRV